VDNITHSLAGWALGQAGLKTRTRKGLAALILGANMPDIDIFFGNAPWDPLAIHRGFTHGLVGGVLFLPPVLAGLLWLLDRWQLSRGATFKSGLPMHSGWLVAVAYLGTLTHPLLDLLTTYSVQLFAPLSKAWYHADGLFIVDIWIWLVLGSAIAWSKRREKRHGNWRRPARAAIAIVLAYIGLNLGITSRAVAHVRALDPEAQSVFASPMPFWSWRRNLVWREDHCYRRSAYDPLTGFGPVTACEPTNMDDPLVREAIGESAALRKFLKWSIMPQADVLPKPCAVRITIGDARYGKGRRSRLARESVVSTGGPGCGDKLDSARPSP
jgi:inner membrane protein